MDVVRIFLKPNWWQIGMKLFVLTRLIHEVIWWLVETLALFA